MMNQDMKFFGHRILFVGAHPDDIEIGAGALISQIVHQTEIICVTLSDNQKNPDLKNLVEEHHNSMAVLGVPKKNVLLGEFETRRFPQARQEILEYLLNLNRSYKPDIIFTHTPKDTHQDHVTVTGEALRAFRGTTVFGFDVLRSSHGFFPNFLVGVSEENVEIKVKSLAQYKTYATKYYFDPNITRATMIRHGALAERPYAEGFETLRAIGRFNIE